MKTVKRGDEDLPDLGPIRNKDDLYDYVSGSYGLPPEDTVTHRVEEMLFWDGHYDRVLWAVRTREGRIIAVMQQRHDDDRSRCGGQVELINAPFADTAIRGVLENIMLLTDLWGVLRRIEAH